MIDVVALGELLIDFTCIDKDQDGYPTMAAHPGGAPANFLSTLAKLGASTALIGKVGDDAFGRMLRDTVKKAGIDTRGLISAKDRFTTLAFVTVDGQGEREFSFARSPGADACLEADEVDLSLIDEARIFHFGSLSLTDEPARSATRKAVAYAKERGKLITYDPNLRMPLWKDADTAREQILWGLSCADVVKLSEEEAFFLFGSSTEEAAEHILSSFPVSLVFVSCGAEGCYYKNALSCGKVPALAGLRVKDTTGAGDIFGASAVWKLLQIGRSPETLCERELRDAVEFACIAAGLSTEKSGGISSVPEYEEIISHRSFYD